MVIPMYDELIKMLRTCSERDSCIGWEKACPYLRTGFCNNKAEKAADAIEDLSKTLDEEVEINTALRCNMPNHIPTTNADRIRAMTDEELVFFFWGTVDGSGKTVEQWREWLKQERVE